MNAKEIKIFNEEEINEWINNALVTVEKNKTIQTKLKETSWPAHYWNESWYLYDEGNSTGLKYVIDFKGKGLANLGFPFLAAYNKSDMKKTINNIKNQIENK